MGCLEPLTDCFDSSLQLLSGQSHQRGTSSCVSEEERAVLGLLSHCYLKVETPLDEGLVVHINPNKFLRCLQENLGEGGESRFESNERGRVSLG